MSLIVGIAIILIGGIASGLFTYPFGFVRGWQWENYWFVYSVYGLVREFRASIHFAVSFCDGVWVRVLMRLPVCRGEDWQQERECALVASSFSFSGCAVSTATGTERDGDRIIERRNRNYAKVVPRENTKRL